MFTKKYFQDRRILLLNLTVILGMLINILATTLRINTSQPIAIIRYQTNLGLAGFERASVWQLYSFVAVAILIALVSIFLSAKLYNMRRSLSLLVLFLATVALLFNLIVSGAVLNLQ